jgi:hypothetical protein
VYSERENKAVLSLQHLELWAPCKARWVWVGAVAKYLFWPCSLQFTKAGSAATLPQEEKKNSANEKWGRVNITGFICTVVS